MASEKKKMTRQQVLRRLERLGVTDVVNQLPSRLDIWATLPDGERGVFDPRELLEIVEARAAALERT